MSYLVWILNTVLNFVINKKVTFFNKIQWFIKNCKVDIILCVNSSRCTCNGKRLTPILLGTQYSGVGWGVDGSQRVGTQYAQILLYRTLTSIFTWKGQIFIKNHSKQSQITLNFSRARYARAFFEVISTFVDINIDSGISKTSKYKSQTHQI